MKCTECGATLHSDPNEGLMLECVACAYGVSVCSCNARRGRTPNRWVHCLDCEEDFIQRINISNSGWRKIRVDPNSD